LLLNLVLFLHACLVSDSEAFTGRVGLPNEALTEREEARGHLKNRSECPSPNRKRPSTSLVESGGMGARTNQRGKAAGSSGCAKEDGGAGRTEEDSKPSLVTSSAAQTGSCLDQEVVQEDATTPDEIRSVQEQATTLSEIPCGWRLDTCEA
jgi:hypothetical protein